MSMLAKRWAFERLENRCLLSVSNLLTENQLSPEQAESATIQIADVNGLRAASVELSYNQDLVKIERKSLRPGSIWGNKGLAVANVDEEAGRIVAFIFATRELPLSGGSLLEFEFTPKRSNSSVDEPIEFVIELLSLNEGKISIDAADELQTDFSRDITDSIGAETPEDLKSVPEFRVQEPQFQASEISKDLLAGLSDQNETQPHHIDVLQQSADLLTMAARDGLLYGPEELLISFVPKPVAEFSHRKNKTVDMGIGTRTSKDDLPAETYGERHGVSILAECKAIEATVTQATAIEPTAIEPIRQTTMNAPNKINNRYPLPSREETSKNSDWFDELFRNSPVLNKQEMR